MGANRITITQLQEMKKKGEKISMVTAYDYSMAKLVDEAGLEMILVGDSLGMVVLGYDTTIPVTLDDMIHHAKAVTRGAKSSLVVADLPFLSYQISTEQALQSARRMMQEAGVQALKLEGGSEIAPTVRALVNAGVPVMGHLGLTPQAVNQLGGFKVQGKDLKGAKKIIKDAEALEEAGAFAIVLECVPAPLAKIITERLSIPVIGIGAGNGCDGQVLVINDLLGFFNDFTPKFVKRYGEFGKQIVEALKLYKQEVSSGQFPAAEHCFSMQEETLSKLY
ncbi:MAG TPA: 3-methyl-2-oxobutanoate hydroxymethyltransferase [Clostridia bacterium]|jgi:3-methyl-2-oxobutanoate hydroxymethyltransferase|nr:3-methyl-2-oxobutanoate hydroxymethyltransferase [Clostridia bacterium]